MVGYIPNATATKSMTARTPANSKASPIVVNNSIICLTNRESGGFGDYGFNKRSVCVICFDRVFGIAFNLLMGSAVMEFGIKAIKGCFLCLGHVCVSLC